MGPRYGLEKTDAAMGIFVSYESEMEKYVSTFLWSRRLRAISFRMNYDLR
jgi:hypothetical protein